MQLLNGGRDLRWGQEKGLELGGGQACTTVSVLLVSLDIELKNSSNVTHFPSIWGGTWALHMLGNCSATSNPQSASKCRFLVYLYTHVLIYIFI